MSTLTRSPHKNPHHPDSLTYDDIKPNVIVQRFSGRAKFGSPVLILSHPYLRKDWSDPEEGTPVVNVEVVGNDGKKITTTWDLHGLGVVKHGFWAGTYLLLVEE